MSTWPRRCSKLTAHLQVHPDDLQSWLLLARSDLDLGRYADAVEAYRHAADLSGQKPRSSAIGAKRRCWRPAAPSPPKRSRPSRPRSPTPKARRARATIWRSPNCRRATPRARCRIGSISKRIPRRMPSGCRYCAAASPIRRRPPGSTRPRSRHRPARRASRPPSSLRLRRQPPTPHQSPRRNLTRRPAGPTCRRATRSRNSPGRPPPRRRRNARR